MNSAAKARVKNAVMAQVPSPVCNAWRIAVGEAAMPAVAAYDLFRQDVTPDNTKAWQETARSFARMQFSPASTTEALADFFEDALYSLGI